jgi:hypothetical protein
MWRYRSPQVALSAFGTLRPGVQIPPSRPGQRGCGRAQTPSVLRRSREVSSDGSSRRPANRSAAARSASVVTCARMPSVRRGSECPRRACALEPGQKVHVARGFGRETLRAEQSTQGSGAAATWTWRCVRYRATRSDLVAGEICPGMQDLPVASEDRLARAPPGFRFGTRATAKCY